MRLILLSFLFLAAAVPAEASFTVCNKGSHTAKIALGRFNGRDWESDGWWTVKPNICTQVLLGPLEARYYYLYATDGRTGTWDGSHGFCVQTGKFSISGRGNCTARGYDRKGFFQVDTGKAADYTHKLSD
ncbi:MAG TPA: DUF1036 domain-containing protein [Rhizomicrobium sp.]|jgi:uncharacterized membrane protein